MALIVAGIVTPAVVGAVDCGQGAPVTATGDWRPPFQQRYIRTSPLGRRYHPIYRECRQHTGQDLASIPVASVRRESDYGNVITLRHRGGITTRYAHLASIDRSIRPGPVIIGQKLGM